MRVCNISVLFHMLKMKVKKESQQTIELFLYTWRTTFFALLIYISTHCTNVCRNSTLHILIKRVNMGLVIPRELLINFLQINQARSSPTTPVTREKIMHSLILHITIVVFTSIKPVYFTREPLTFEIKLKILNGSAYNYTL